MDRRNCAGVKQPQAVLPTKNLTLTLLPASPRPILKPIFRPFCSDAKGLFLSLFLDLFIQKPLASYGATGQKESGCQWRLTELNRLSK